MQKTDKYCEPLIGNKGHYKLRSGEYRIIIKISNNELQLIVLKIGHRKNAHNNFHAKLHNNHEIGGFIYDIRP